MENDEPIVLVSWSKNRIHFGICNNRDRLTARQRDLEARAIGTDTPTARIMIAAIGRPRIKFNSMEREEVVGLLSRPVLMMGIPYAVMTW